MSSESEPTPTTGEKQQQSAFAKIWFALAASAKNSNIANQRDLAWVCVVVLGFLFFGSILACTIGGFAAIAWSLAALSSGCLTGFLFGIPRVFQQDPDDDEAEYRQAVNTNLEQISDWLTKIIVGMGLIHLQEIPGQFQSLAEFISNEAECSAGSAGSLLVLFAVIGFFASYLITRLYLAGAFSRAARIEHSEDSEAPEEEPEN